MRSAEGAKCSSPGQSAQRDALGENIANYNLFAL